MVPRLALRLVAKGDRPRRRDIDLLPAPQARAEMGRGQIPVRR